jgi:hypothetical protein
MESIGAARVAVVRVELREQAYHAVNGVKLRVAAHLQYFVGVDFTVVIGHRCSVSGRQESLELGGGTLLS